jgi:hypothetical protein
LKRAFCRNPFPIFALNTLDSSVFKCSTAKQHSNYANMFLNFGLWLFANFYICQLFPLGIIKKHRLSAHLPEKLVALAHLIKFARTRCLLLSNFINYSMPKLPELRELENLLELGNGHMQSRIACEVDANNQRFPVYELILGNPDPKLPAIGFFGGVHGLERIGTHVLLHFLRSLLSRLEWDKSLHLLLQDVRLIPVACVSQPAAILMVWI